MEDQPLKIPEQSQKNGTSHDSTQSQLRCQNVALASAELSIFQV